MKRRLKKNLNAANLFLIAALVIIVTVFVFAPTGKFFTATDYTIDSGDYILELTPTIESTNYTLTLHADETFSQTIPLEQFDSTNDLYSMTPIAALDEDADGVQDYELQNTALVQIDQCPNTPTGETVTASGCGLSQTDADGDSVSDTSDLCPNTPATETANAQGCSSSQTDTDSDGVMDSNDQCPNTPATETANSIGCSISQIPEKAILLRNTIYNVNDLVSANLINLDKTTKAIYWFDGIQETDYEIYDDAPNQRTLCRATATSYCTIDSATYTSLAFGEKCSCATFEDDLPSTFKIYSDHVTKSDQFVKVYRTADACSETGCTIQAHVIYEDDSVETLSATFEVVGATARDLSNPYGPNSQDCSLGGDPIINSGWCCVEGYTANPDITEVSLTGEDIDACQPYSNQPPTASFSSSATNISIGDTVTFDASASRDIDGIITEYSWDFGDNTQGNGETTTHTYATACAQNQCQVTLTIKDNFNQISNDTILLDIKAPTLSEEPKIEETSTTPASAAQSVTQQQAALEQQRQALQEQQQQLQQQALSQQQEPTRGGFGWLLALVLLALLGVGGWFAYKKFGGKKPPAPPTTAQPTTPSTPAQPTASPIRNFISTKKQQGLSNEEIRTKLRGKGWRDGDIDRYMNASRT